MPETQMLVYGLNTESADLVHISSCKSGLSELVCPQCRTQLIARMGSQNTWHFAHYNPERQLTENSRSCSYSKESELHLAGKHLFNRLVQDTGLLRLPEFTLTYKQIANSPALSTLTKNQKNFVLAKAGTNPEPSTGVSFPEVSHQIDHCELEPTEGMEGYRPDVQLSYRGQPVAYIEVVVSNDVSTKKMRHFHHQRIPVLRYIPAGKLLMTDEDMLGKAVKQRVDLEWVYHPIESSLPDSVFGEMEQFLAQREETRKQVLKNTEQGSTFSDTHLLQPDPVTWYEANLREGFRKKLEGHYQSSTGASMSNEMKAKAAHLYFNNKNYNGGITYLELARMLKF
ncbi:competence protein CoiA family protein [Marinospirillum insulare]|uniref:Competence protein CoiA-like N-terminal domain-containing protein n=1 Tax=Marinospirillum insulare TaxID=217169 RepID=A0ABQ5ZUQ7_9GAMM|nr:competence protein CoiA family protein [Marinospirillum insulare]GLR62773.1 hypothetical protein GCM10007878_02080 [Marinospirillum insulare]